MKGRNIWIDFETKSHLDLTKVGATKYLKHPDAKADIVCLGWAIDDGPVNLWTPKHKHCPIKIKEGDNVYAHNIQFDRAVWNHLGKKYLFPRLRLRNCVDIMALCGRYTYPQGLDFAGRVLNLPIPKDAKGKRLIKKVCCPPFTYTESDLLALYAYCRRDVIAMRDLVARLPMDHLSTEEQLAWTITVEMNERGLPVDVPLVNRMLEAVELQKKRALVQVPRLTGGAVKAPTQVAAIREWCEAMGVWLPNLQAETVTATLERDDLPAKVRTMLELRKNFGRTSIAKLVKIREQELNGRVYGNLRYYGAGTGRWAGLGLQPHNFPRASVPDIEAEIELFRSGKIMQANPIESAKALIRPCIKAPKGKRLVVIDFSSIENVTLAWVAGEQSVLDIFARGEDEYTHFATQLFGYGYAEVDKKTRAYCKPIVLGAGYTLAAKGLLKYALGFGVQMQRTDAETAITTYRTSRPMIVKFWYEAINCAVQAILNPGYKFGYRGCEFKLVKDKSQATWLQLRLPSGRNLYYNSPVVKEYTYGPLPTAEGINGYTKQWERMKIIPGRMTENIVQALARDVLLNAKKLLRQKGYTLICSVHDEVICEEPSCFNEDDFQRMSDLMCTPPLWAPDLPLRVEGAILERYQKL